MPLCMRILKQQLGMGWREPPAFPASLCFKAISFLIYNGEYLGIRPEIVTKAEMTMMKWNDLKWGMAVIER